MWEHNPGRPHHLNIFRQNKIMGKSSDILVLKNPMEHFQFDG